ncbi:PIG-L deacetylase family protein [Chelativorans salis]|uniref:PIG-L family deacetylase n=1 Tax=Chelativorans salis TaxID=2978478 RepID=A0ABT2LQV5_9HYPH|nr:PIG-L deacetylase family protein [Chelativorans sp. EGI FJ00035]MCT7376928.1 PIG-L family deacetylase [Chelativorans sp. EGI FJ00035]
MTDPLAFGRTLVVAPHPDDEILGVGGTIARLARAGEDVFVAIVTSGRPPTFSPSQIATVRGEAEHAHALLGVRRTFWLDFPAAGLADTPHSELNSALQKLVVQLRPATMLLPFVGDMHLDHQLSFASALVAARPHQADYPERILAYETLSETNWNAPYLTAGFHPNLFVEIGETLPLKLEAMGIFETQLKAFPHERSLEALKALALLRGATVHLPAAEAFVLVRHVVQRARTEAAAGV